MSEVPLYHVFDARRGCQDLSLAVEVGWSMQPQAQLQGYMYFAHQKRLFFFGSCENAPVLFLIYSETHWKRPPNVSY